MPDKLVVSYSYMTFKIDFWPTEIEGQSIAEWCDIAVGDYGSTTSPRGNMTEKQCSGISMEFNNGSGGNFSASIASNMRTKGKGWFMGFAPDPLKNYNGSVDKDHWRNIFARRLGEVPRRSTVRRSRRLPISTSSPIPRVTIIPTTCRLAIRVRRSPSGRTIDSIPFRRRGRTLPAERF